MRLLKGAAVFVAALLAVAAGLVLWPSAAAPLPERTQRMMLTNARVIDVENGQVGSPTSLLIEGGLIHAIGPEIAAPPGTREIDVRGAILTPGFIDMHSHSWKVSPQLHLPLQVAHGITSVRDMMGCPEADDPLLACAADKKRWTAAADRGELVSPRFLGSASFYYDDAALSPAGARARVRSDKARGIDYLKVYNLLNLAAYEAVIDEGAKLRLPVVGHLPRAVPLLTAIDRGQRSIEHARIFIEGCFRLGAQWRSGRYKNAPRPALLAAMLDRRDEKLCATARQQMAAKQVAFVPTLITREEDARAQEQRFLDDPRLDYADSLSRWAWNDDQSGTVNTFPGTAGERLLKRALNQAMIDTLDAYRAGVPVLVGSDTIIAGPRYHDELALLVQAGLTPAQALRSATLDAARWIGRPDLGSIAVGKHADIVILEANPLTDIRNSTRIVAVIADGHLYDRALLDRLLKFTHSQARHPGNWAKMLWGFARSPLRSSL